MKFRPFYLIYSITSIICIVVMFYTKRQVQYMRKNLLEIENRISNEEEDIQVLKAEWAYLSSPKKIKELSDKYLNLKTINKNQIATPNKKTTN